MTERQIYEQLANEKGSTVWKLQKGFQKIFGFTLPLFHGRGIFNYNLGLMVSAGVGCVWRSLYQIALTLQPFRHPIVSVSKYNILSPRPRPRPDRQAGTSVLVCNANAPVGRPIDVRKDNNPSDEYVQEVHAQYIDELVRIWDKYKDLYAKTRTRELRVVD